MGILRLHQSAFRQIRRLSIIFSVLALASHAADNGLSIANPRLGGVFDEQAKQLRLVEGIPGSATLGGAIDAGNPIEQAWIVPQAKRALVRFTGKTGLALVDWNGSVQTLMADDIKSEAVTLAAISPSGKAFAVLIDGGVESWRIAPTGLNRLWRADLNADQTSPTSLAISDDGELVAAALPGRLAVISQSGYANTLSEMDFLGAMSFAHNSHVFALAREDSNSAFLYDAPPSQSNVEIKWESNMPEKISGLGFSGDNASIAIASATDTGGQIRLFTVSDGRMKAALETRNTPNGIFRANGNAVFQLTTSAKPANTILDGDADEPRLVTVAGQEISND